MSASLGHSLLKLARERRRSVLYYHAEERAHPDRAAYYRGLRKRAFVSALQALDWARAELETDGLSLQSMLQEAALQHSREMHAHREAAE